MTLEWVTQWFNILYLLPLGLALLYLGVYAVSGWTFGEAEVEHGVGIEHDVAMEHDVAAEHDAGVEHDAHADAGVHATGGHAAGTTHHAAAHHQGILSWLGVGRVPMSLILMLVLLSFGTIGFMANQAVRNVVQDGAIIFVSLPIALAGAGLVTRTVTRLLHRFMPMNETYAERKSELLGLTGEAIYEITETFGLAAVRDRRGNLHQVPCRVDAGRAAIDKGNAVTLVGFSPQSQVYTVIPDSPLALGRLN